MDNDDHIEFDLNNLRDNFYKKAFVEKSEEDIDRIKSAYEYAAKCHEGQFRKSGLPYIIHPIAVATIVANELKLGTNPIIAALLHDVVEDTDATIEDITSMFGDDVAFLVGVVTKAKKKQYEYSKQEDNFRQMLDSLNYDIRALLLKLADRLHNMRTLASMRPDKQMKIAGETDYFYAPLANRLGLYKIKSELENLSLKYRIPVEYSEIEAKLTQYERENRDIVANFIEPFKQKLRDMHIDADVKCKTRSVCAIYRKMQNAGISFRQVEPLQVVDLVFKLDVNSHVTEKNQCLSIYSVLTSLYKEKPGSLVNYIDQPKENGYQSLHCKVMCDSGEWMEVHIASDRMDYNSSLGCVARKDQGLGHWVESFKTTLMEIANYGRKEGYIEDVVCNFYNDDITVFSPKGQALVLPKGATAIDFAYNIHTNIGNQAYYAKINGVLSSIKTVLKRGDRVEIGTRETATPQRDWLNHIKTFKARKVITSYFRRLDEMEKPSPYVFCSRCNPIPGDEVIGFRTSADCIEVHKRSCPDAISRSAKAGDTIVSVKLPANMKNQFGVSIKVIGIDRNGLLYDLVNVISNELKLTMDGLSISVIDNVANCVFNLRVHSTHELTALTACLSLINGVEEVMRISQ